MQPSSRLLVCAALASAALACACSSSDDACDVGAGKRCNEHTGPLEVSYCQPDQTWSECTEAVQCNPLTQQGCEDGLACFFVGYWTFCAPPDSFLCGPGEEWAHGSRGSGASLTAPMTGATV